MEFDIWLKFLIGTTLVCATPGPNMLLVMASSINFGLKRSLYTMAGCLLAVCILISLSTAGIGALLLASPNIFEFIKILGAIYLIYIGYKSIKDYKSFSGLKTEGLEKNKTNIENFKKGFFVGISNPKAILFAIAYFSQFISSEKSFVVQFSILFISFIILECACYLAYALGGNSITKFISNDKFRYGLNITIGALFIFFGISLLLWKMG
jgi:threonine/homoserine/homoserine lactone efflux protein